MSDSGYFDPENDGAIASTPRPHVRRSGQDDAAPHAASGLREESLRRDEDDDGAAHMDGQSDEDEDAVSATAAQLMGPDGGETSAQQTRRSERNVKAHRQMLCELNVALEQLVSTRRRARRSGAASDQQACLKAWQAVQTSVAAVQKGIIPFRSGRGKRMHLQNGFFLNLPFAYMSRRFPDPLERSKRPPIAQLAIARVSSPVDEQYDASFDILESLLLLAGKHAKTSDAEAKTKWLAEHGFRNGCPWILITEK